jgi:hypothetical protein
MKQAAIVLAALFVLIAAAPAPEKPIAVHEHEAGGVDVALWEVKRTGPEVITVKWSYTNKTGQRKQLTDKRTGWPDPYRLVFEGYLMDDESRTKYPVLTDSDQHPVAPRHGGVNEFVYLAPHQTLKTWAKFAAPPAETKTIGVYIPRVEPFENVPIK